jgi:hypothetical protein
MSEGEKGKKFLERTIIADPNRFKPAEEKLSDYQKKTRKDREKKQQQARQEQSAREAALNATSQLSENSALNREYPIADYKETLGITPSKSVPEGMNPFLPTPMELERGTVRERITPSDGTALDFKLEKDNLVFDEIDPDEPLPPEEKGGRKRKSRKLRKSPKKSRKSKRKTTRKNRQHRRR